MRRFLPDLLPDAAVGDASDPVDRDGIRAGGEQVPVEKLRDRSGLVDGQAAAREAAFVAGAGERDEPAVRLLDHDLSAGAALPAVGGRFHAVAQSAQAPDDERLQGAGRDLARVVEILANVGRKRVGGLERHAGVLERPRENAPQEGDLRLLLSVDDEDLGHGIGRIGCTTRE